MAHSEKCPICKGKGKIDKTEEKVLKFKKDLDRYSINSWEFEEDAYETCHGCNGKGWVEISDGCDCCDGANWNYGTGPTDYYSGEFYECYG